MNNLPIEEMKEYGILNNDNSYSKKLTKDDVDKFLKGYAMVVDNDKNRVIFQLKNNNTELQVDVFERQNSLKDIVSSNKDIQYSEIKNLSKKESQYDIEKKVFINNNGEIKEYDMIKDIKEVSTIIQEKKDEKESNKYRIELLKLKGYLQDKIDKFPDVAKEITENMNIVSREINSITGVSLNEKQKEKAKNTKVTYDVNDPDLYQDANLERQEKAKEEQEIKRTGRRR